MAITSIILISLLIIFIHLIPKISSQINQGDQGEWRLLRPSVGIYAMHMQLLRSNKVIMFDRATTGPSNISLPRRQCRHYTAQLDCTAHSVLYDIASNTVRPLTLQTDAWCSSGSVTPDGTLIQTGGYEEGDRTVRMFSPCSDDSCDWRELPNYLIARRWYATSQILPDGRVIIVGGRRQFNYEFFPRQSSTNTVWLELLRETVDDSRDNENNLYPFVHLLPDGNLFMFANTRSILLNYNQNAVVKELPEIPDKQPRNYPSSGSSVLLPLDENKPHLEAEILVCGGAPRGSRRRVSNGRFINAVSTCGRIMVSDRNPSWSMEDMPIARVMGDMLILPSGGVVIINGAGLGTAGWENARGPVTRPVIYNPSEYPQRRFTIMAQSSRPRLYHSSAVLIPDGRVLVGGSNPHVYYNFTGVEYPTDLSLEAFSPPYLSKLHNQLRPRIVSVNGNIGYGQSFSVRFSVPQYLGKSRLSVRLIAPSFTTHSFAMNQRMVVTKMTGVKRGTRKDTYEISTVGPSRPEVAPPGFYLLFVVHVDIPSSAMWVRLQ